MAARTSADRWDRFWRARQQADDFYAATTAFREHVLAHVGPRTRVLEVGPGTGRDAAAFATKGGNVTVLDRSGEALALMHRSGLIADNLALLRGNGLCSPFAAESFDVVCHQGLLEHFRDPMPLLRDNLRVLRPGGILVVDVPQTFHVWTLIKHTLIAVNRWFAGWETQYTPSQLRRVVQSAGFEVVDTYADWMRPGLWYRSLHAVASRLGVAVPQVPPWRTSWPLGEWWLRQGVGHWTGCTVGVVARKCCGSNASVAD